MLNRISLRISTEIMKRAWNIRYGQEVYTCSVLKNRCAFSPTGEIYPCDMMMYDEYRIGDIKNGFDNAAISKMRTIMQDESQCQECWARYLCGGEQKHI